MKTAILKKIFTGSMVAGVLALAMPTRALTINDDHTIGQIQPGLPSGGAEAYVAQLIDMYNGGVAGPIVINSGDDDNADQGNTDNTYTAIAANFGAFGILPDPSDGNKLDNSTNTRDVTGYLYFLGKYGGGQGDGYSVLWYVGDLTGSISIPSHYSGNQLQLSHTILFNPNSTRVPDGGATAALLGLGFLGLAAISRKRG